MYNSGKMYENGLLVSYDYLYSEFTKVAPDDSKIYSLRPGEISDVQFDVILEEFRDLVRFYDDYGSLKLALRTTEFFMLYDTSLKCCDIIDM